MTERVKKLKDKTTAARPFVCWERGKIITESYKATAGEPKVMRRALALKDILEKMSLAVDEDELIVGNHASGINGAPLYPEFSIEFLVKEMDEFARRPYDNFDVCEKTKQVIGEIAPYWRGQTHEDLVVSVTRRVLPEEVLPVWEEGPFRLNDILYNGVRKSAGDGHMIPDYFRLMKEGIPGVIAEARAALEKLDYQYDTDAFKKKLFLDAVLVSFQAVAAWFRRFAEEARRLAKTARPENKLTLNETATVCDNLAENSPQNFREAIQLTYFLHLLLHIESNGHSISMGRIDQYLYPFYEADIKSGALGDEQALELIDCMYIKISKFNKVRPWPETRNKSGAPMFMTVTLAGQTRDGKDAANPLTELFLAALADTRLPQPTPIVRVAPSTSPELLVNASKALLAHGGGLPAFFSDEAIIAALTRMGMPLEDARDYGIGGCSEAVGPGKSPSFCGGDCYFNFVTLLEVILHEGKKPRTGQRMRLCKPLEEYASIDDLIGEFRKELSYYISLVVQLTSITSWVDGELNPTPFASGLMAYRIALGKDISEGGGPNAIYSHTILQGHGTGDVSNALYAIDQLVFKKKELGLRAFVEVLDGNWQSEAGKSLKDKVRRIPKYGNDIDEVDEYAVRVSNIFADEAEKYTPYRGGKFGISLQGLTANVPEGETVGATPDGRSMGEALSDNISPHAGTDVSGPTSTLKSVSKVDHPRFVNGNILNLRFHPSALTTSYGDFDLLRGRRFADMIQTYLVDLKGNQVQFNIVSAAALREAQAKPEENKDLIVKVAGYSAYFASLDKSLQDQIIERTEHTL
jgi:formate C-acetyltransferase